MYANYQEMTKAHQDLFNDLPIFWAFSDDQLKEGMEKYPLRENEKYVRIGGGGFIRGNDVQQLTAVTEQTAAERRAFMADTERAKQAFRYEMDNHEYCINWDGDADVLACFDMTPDDMTADNPLYTAYTQAAHEHNKYALEHDWI